MTTRTSAPPHRRDRPIHAHVYTVPVVRELPAGPPRALEAQSLW